MPRFLLVLLAALVVSGCSTNYHVEARTEYPSTRKVPNHPPAAPAKKTPAQPAKKETPATFHIPPGHMPREGQCRIWIPGVPPGKQAPAGDCNELVGQVPPGAWLVRGTAKKSKEFEVVVYDERRPQVVVEIRLFSKKDGSFLGLR